MTDYYTGGTIGSSEQTGLTETDRRLGNVSPAFSYQLYGGYQFNHVISVELALTNHGKLKEDYKPDGKETIKGYIKTRAKSLALQANIGYTLNNGIRPYGLAGLSWINIDSSTDASQTSTEEEDSIHSFYNQKNRVALRFGMGTDYAPVSLDGLTFRLEYTLDIYTLDWESPSSIHSQYTDVMRLRNLSVGIGYKF
ncbi:MAG: porin family protein [Psychromonas sp.]|nr:porin family protein [Psychromonas sp.]